MEAAADEGADGGLDEPGLEVINEPSDQERESEEGEGDMDLKDLVSGVQSLI